MEAVAALMVEGVEAIAGVVVAVRGVDAKGQRADIHRHIQSLIVGKVFSKSGNISLAVLMIRMMSSSDNAAIIFWSVNLSAQLGQFASNNALPCAI